MILNQDFSKVLINIREKRWGVVSQYSNTCNSELIKKDKKNYNQIFKNIQ